MSPTVKIIRNTLHYLLTFFFERETERDRERQRETERDRERQRETERERKDSKLKTLKVFLRKPSKLEKLIKAVFFDQDCFSVIHIL